MGWSRHVEKNALLKEVNSSGAVSPATRARATRMPVTMPGSAAGRITVHTARERVAPRASAPSLKDSGTSRSSSSVVRTMRGSIITPRATPPASAEKRRNGITATA